MKLAAKLTFAILLLLALLLNLGAADFPLSYRRRRSRTQPHIGRSAISCKKK